MSRYSCYTDNKSKVIVTSTYAGRTVRGTAKCAEGDTFNLNKGIILAQCRCDLKVATKRKKRASDKIDSIVGKIDVLLKELEDAKDYYDNAYKAEQSARDNLKYYLDLFKN